MSKPILLAMNNPLARDPWYALYPSPRGCSGWRLWRLLVDVRPGVNEDDYLRVFDRRNLVPTVHWDAKVARAAAADLLASVPRGTTVVALGVEVRVALSAGTGGQLPPVLLHPQEVGGLVVRQLPHPSGRCHWYNHPTHRALAGMLLGELYDAAS